MTVPKVKWTRLSTGGSAYVVRDDHGRDILHVHQKDHCRFWYVFVGPDQDEADGARFRRLWEAKAYAERQLKFGRVSLTANPTDMFGCRECQQEFELQDLIDGVCEDCNREECEACDGTGSVDSDDPDEVIEDCEECGGEGRI
jgi:hypothetical protein